MIETHIESEDFLDQWVESCPVLSRMDELALVEGLSNESTDIACRDRVVH